MAALSGKPFTVDELLKRAEAIVERQPWGNQVDRVELSIAIGSQYSIQDEVANARRVPEQVYTLSREISEASSRADACCALAGTLAQDGDFQRAEALFQEGLRTLPDLLQYALVRNRCLLHGGEVARARGD